MRGVSSLPAVVLPNFVGLQKLSRSGAPPRSHALKETPGIVECLDLHDLADLDAKNIDQRDRTKTGVGLPHRRDVITIRDVADYANVVDDRQINVQETSHVIAAPNGLPRERAFV